jgi:hypothetical protein
MRTQHTPDASTKAQVEEIFIRWEKSAAKDAVNLPAFGRSTASHYFERAGVLFRFLGIISPFFNFQEFLRICPHNAIPFNINNMQAAICYVSENLNESPISVHWPSRSAILAVQSQLFSRRFHREKDLTAACCRTSGTWPHRPPTSRRQRPHLPIRHSMQPMSRN